MKELSLKTRVASAFAAEARAVSNFFRFGRRSDKKDFITPGLHAYTIERNGGITRLHLRVENNGTGTLFADVSDAVSLSPSAVEMVWLALNHFDERSAINRLLLKYRGVNRLELTIHYRRMAGLVDKLSDPKNTCRTCSIDYSPTFERKPLFSIRANAPYKADLALTYACNNACPHCYNEPDRSAIETMSTDEWKSTVDRLADIGVPHLIFTGGEPTLHNGLTEIISHAHSRGLICGINTNARRLSNPAFLRELVESGLDHVQVTLHSYNATVHDKMAGTPAFHETVAGLKAALECRHSLHVITNTTLTRTNAMEAEKTVRFLHSLGLRTFAMNALIHAGGGKESSDVLPNDFLAALLVQIREVAAELSMRFLWYTVSRYCELSPMELDIGAKRCNAAEYSICIEPNGDVLPCQSYYSAAGNILGDSWQSIWESNLFQSFRDRETNPVAGSMPEKCLDCPDLSVCGGGCRLENEARCKGCNGQTSCL